MHAQPQTQTDDLDAFEISTDKGRLDLDRVEQFLRASYWASGRPRSLIERSIANSLCVGVYRRSDGLQVGFCRIVTDYATFGWLADVFIDGQFRGRKLGERMLAALISLPEVAGLRLVLATRDAHSLYEKVGFEVLPNPDRWMIRPEAGEQADSS
jgi:GNAT superfamily N-acetyltransferase